MDVLATVNRPQSPSSCFRWIATSVLFGGWRPWFEKRFQPRGRFLWLDPPHLWIVKLLHSSVLRPPKWIHHPSLGSCTLLVQFLRLLCIHEVQFWRFFQGHSLFLTPAWLGRSSDDGQVPSTSKFSQSQGTGHIIIWRCPCQEPL